MNLSWNIKYKKLVKLKIHHNSILIKNIVVKNIKHEQTI